MNFKELETQEKLRGGYYTDPDIVRFLLAWVLEINPRTLLEPSCGDGAFLTELGRLDSDSLEKVVGFEIVEAEAEKAKLATQGVSSIDFEIHQQDFLEWYLRRSMDPVRFDSVVGNPPFIRYQYLDKASQLVAEGIFKQFNLAYTKHTNAWVPFVISSIGALEPSGRIAMVLPAEILHILHASSLRQFLVQQCSKILILDPDEIWFADTLQGAVLFLGEKKTRGGGKPAAMCIRRTKDREDLTKNPSTLFNASQFSPAEDVDGKWMKALLSAKDRALLERIEQMPGVKRFSEVADVSVGIVTGANQFFLIDDETVSEYALDEWSYPMFGRSNHVPGVVYDEAVHTQNKAKGLRGNFLWFKAEDDGNLPPRVKEYLRSGEVQGLHKRYKCRIREPWYSVPSVFSTEVGMLKRSHNYPRLIHNKLGAFTTDTAYRVRPVGVSAPSLVFSFVNSLTALSAELEGRHYGGGVLELVPSEIRKLLVPICAADDRDVLGLDSNVRETESPLGILEIQDKRVLKRLGLSNEEASRLRDAWLVLKQRRQRDR